MFIKINSFLVVGLKKSGFSISKLLLEKGAEVYVYDENSKAISDKNKKELEALGAKVVEDPISSLEFVEVLVLSPGVPIDNEIAITARKLNKRIVGELELASYFVTAPIVAVSGTNGKTTVCSLISHVLSSSNVKNVLVGNIGTPLSSMVSKIEEDTVCVTEVSSFQLETISRFTPHISCLLNITPDHLDRHYNMQNYIFLKSKMLLNLKESEYAVLNYDDKNIVEMQNKTKGKIVWFSANERVDGAYLDKDNIMFFDEVVLSIKDLNIMGKHIVLNALASVAVLKLLGVNNSEIEKGIKTFNGVKHRIELVKKLNDITFYNDSKSTNPDATIKAINTIKAPTVLILGGYDKGLDYTFLMQEISKRSNIKNVVITGMSANKMYETAIKNNVKNVSVVQDFKVAIKLSYMLAKKGGAVLFSPATSSFDNFSDFEERGEKFIETVNSL